MNQYHTLSQKALQCMVTDDIREVNGTLPGCLGDMQHHFLPTLEFQSGTAVRHRGRKEAHYEASQVEFMHSLVSCVANSAFPCIQNLHIIRDHIKVSILLQHGLLDYNISMTLEICYNLIF